MSHLDAAGCRPRCGQQIGHAGTVSLDDASSGEAGGELGIGAQRDGGHREQHPFQSAGVALVRERDQVHADDLGRQGPELAGDRRGDRLQRPVVVAEPLGRPPVQIPPLPARCGLGAEDVGEQSMQPVPAARTADGLDEQVRGRKVGQQSGTVVPAGEGVGELGADHVDGADLAEEVQQLG